jgi:O-antigen ligase
VPALPVEQAGAKARRSGHEGRAFLAKNGLMASSAHLQPSVGSLHEPTSTRTVQYSLALAAFGGALVGANLWAPIGVFLVVLWALVAPLLTAPAMLLLLLCRSSLDSWAENAEIVLGGASINPMGLANLFLLATMGRLFLNDLLSQRRAFASRTLTALLGFTCFLVCTILWAGDRGQATRDVVRFAALAGAFVITANLVLHQPAWARRIVIGMCLSFLVPAWVAAIQFFSGTGLVDSTGFHRLFGTAWNPNAFAVYCLFANLLALPLVIAAWRSGRPAALAYGSLFVLSAMLAFLTYTRAVWMAMPVGWVVVAWFSGRRTSQRLAKAGQLLGLGVMAVLLLWPLFYSRFADEWEVVSSLTAQQRVDPHYATPVLMRFFLWGVAIDMFRAHPLIGNGWGMYSLHLPAVSPLPSTWDPHNDYLLLAAETGIVGLVLFLALMAVAFRAFATNARTSSGLAQALNIAAAASLVAYLITAATNNLFQYSGATLYFWTLAGLAQGLAAASSDSAMTRGTDRDANIIAAAGSS